MPPIDHYVSSSPGPGTLELPRQSRDTSPQPDTAPRPLKVCMVAYTFYETDNRVRRYAEALAARGDTVEVVALRHPGQAPTESICGVTVHRIQERVINEKRKLDYLSRLVRFFVASGWFLTRRTVRGRYDVIHVHSVPDFEIFAALIPRLAGAKTILDIHDIVPEFYCSKFGCTVKSFLYRALRLVERFSCAFADHVIIANDLWREKLVARSVRTGKCSAYLNYPDQRVFSPSTTAPRHDGFTVLYPGTLNRHQGLDIALRAFAAVCDKAPGAEFHIYGEGADREDLIQLAADLRLNERVRFKKLVPLDEIGRVMAGADLGIVPKRNNSFGGEAFSTKIFEFMSLGVPVLAAKTKIDQYYFDESAIRFFTPGDEADCARALLELMQDAPLRNRLAANARMLMRQYSWDVHRQRYFDLVDSLVGRPTAEREPEKESVLQA